MQIGEKWMDGTCRECECVQLDGGVEPVCAVQTCTDAPESDTYVSERVAAAAGECCPSFRQTACLSNGTVFVVRLAVLRGCYYYLPVKN